MACVRIAPFMDRERDEREPARRREPEPVPATEVERLGLPLAAGNQAVGRMLARFKRPRPGAAPFAYESEQATKVTGAGHVTLERPTKASGTIHPTGVPARAATAVPKGYRQTSVATGLETVDPLLGYDGGHIIGLHLGGDNYSENVVPMFPGFNRGAWKNMEDATKLHMQSHPGRTYRMTVDLDYAGSALPEVPVRLTVTREERDDDGNWVPMLPPVTLSQPADIPQTQRLPAHEEAIVNPAPDKNGLADVPAGVYPDLFETGDQTLDAYINAHQHLPEAKKALYPDSPADRPYERLDLLTLNRTIAARGLLEPFREFSAAQRELILQTNMARNGGVLRSDDPDDPHQVLSERGTADAPEIDHIIPKSQGGSSFYSNARVVSWQLNNKEARVKPLTGLVDTNRLALPAALPTLMAEKVPVLVDLALARWDGGAITAQAVIGWGAQQSYAVNDTKRTRDAVERELDQLVTAGKLTKSGGEYTRV